MCENIIREARAVPNTTPNGLLAPLEKPSNNSRSRSPSLAPSIQSHLTTIENKADELEFRNARRRQTFKIQRKPTLWDWLKGGFNREAFMRRLEDSVRIVQPETPPESDFIVNVFVSPKTNSTQYEKARCLLDTGCFSGNLVTRHLVESLGYLEDDLQQPTPLESKGGQTLTGEPFHIEGVIFLSWHHGSSPIIYRKMRFLVVSSAQFEMIIGSDTITKHSLLVPPVFNTGAVNEDEEDPMLLEPKLSHRKMHTKVQDDEKFLERERKKLEAQRDNTKIRSVEARLPRRRHMRKVLQHRLDAVGYRSKGKLKDAERAEDLAKKEVEAWKTVQNTDHSTNAATDVAQNGKTPSTRPPSKRGSGHSE